MTLKHPPTNPAASNLRRTRTYRAFAQNFEIVRTFASSNDFANRDQGTWNAALIAAALLSLADAVQSAGTLSPQEDDHA